MTNGISLGICAMDYRGAGPYENGNTPGLIVDDVSDYEQPCIYLPTYLLFLRTCIESW
jgi:hypothetical protein